MEEKVISLFLKKIPVTSDMDIAGMADVSGIIKRITPEWPSDTLQILQDINPDLLEMLRKTENQIDSMLAIESKPPQVRKEFKKTLNEYARVVGMCSSYAKRHTKTK